MESEREPTEIDYEKLLQIRQVDFPSADDRYLAFAVADNYNVFVTTGIHAYLANQYGIDLEKTLTEGNIKLNPDGAIKDLWFRRHPYQSVPGFSGSPGELKKLEQAVERLLRAQVKTFSRED